MKAKKTKTDENEFEALDQLARSITLDKLRPLTPRQQAQWEAAKRGRPKKPPDVDSRLDDRARRPKG